MVEGLEVFTVGVEDAVVDLGGVLRVGGLDVVDAEEDDEEGCAGVPLEVFVDDSCGLQVLSYPSVDLA